MAKTPSEQLKQAGEFHLYQMSLLGTTLNLWSQTELIIEMVIKEALGLALEDTCILCGPLGAGAKVALLKSLLSQRGTKPKFVQAVADFQVLIGRNAIVHGFVTFEKIDEPWLIVSREVRDKLSVKTKPILRYLEDDIMPAFDRVMETSGFSDDDLHKYSLEIKALAK